MSFWKRSQVIVKLIVGLDDNDAAGVDTYRDCTKAFRDAIEANIYDVIIVDHSVAMKNIRGVEKYDLYIDEIPPISKTITLDFSIPIIRNLISTLFPAWKISDSHLYYEMEYNKEIADLFTTCGEDEAFKPNQNLREIGQALKSGDYRIVIRGSQLKSYNGSLEGEQKSGHGSGTRLKFHSVMQPSVLQNYGSVTVMGANFDTSEMYFAWDRKVDFVEHTEMKRHLRPLPDRKKGLINILYLSEAHDTWASLEKLGYQEFLDSVANAYEAAFPDAKHIIAIKKAKDKYGRPTEPYRWRHEDSGLGLRLDPSSKGVNGLQHINVALHLVPINPSTYEYNFRKEYFGMTADDVKWAITDHAIENIISKWAVAQGLGKGGTHFYQAGVDLKKMGCSYQEVVEILDANRHRFGHGKDRYARDAANHIFKQHRQLHNYNDNTQELINLAS